MLKTILLQIDWQSIHEQTNWANWGNQLKMVSFYYCTRTLCNFKKGTFNENNPETLCWNVHHSCTQTNTNLICINVWFVWNYFANWKTRVMVSNGIVSGYISWQNSGEANKLQSMAQGWPCSFVGFVLGVYCIVSYVCVLGKGEERHLTVHLLLSFSLGMGDTILFVCLVCRSGSTICLLFKKCSEIA